MAPPSQTIAVIDKSGKVISTSKHLFGVFHHAKAAYRERKSQYQSERSAKLAEQQALQGLANYQIDDSPSAASDQRRTKSQHQSSRNHHRRRTSSHYEQDLHAVRPRPNTCYAHPEAIPRRHTDLDVTVRQPTNRPPTARSRSDAHIDMDLAYGDAHPSALSLYSPSEKKIENKKPLEDTKQLDGLVNRAQWLLEEAHCVHHSATATMAHLQKNPDAMAAVALTLAEISNLVSKMAPAALSALKTAAPTVWALLASPQFLIAAGVGLGVTVVMFGGYKIVKKIQSGKTDREKGSAQVDDMMELNMESLSQVEQWRRGVADVEAVSMGTSVDGEFITPTAAAMSGMDVTTARLCRDRGSKYGENAPVTPSRRSRRSRASRAQTRGHASRHKKPESVAPSKGPSRLFFKAFSKTPRKARSNARSKTSIKTPSQAGTQVSESEKRPKDKKKRSSRLRLMFTS